MTLSTRALSNRQIARAALVVLFGFLTSGLLGLVRTAVITATFGAGEALDAFYAAQRIPEMLFVLVAGGALGSSFLPVFARLRAGEDDAPAWRLASAALTLTTLAAAGLALLIGLLSPWIVPTLLVPGKPAAVQALTLALTQLMLVTTVVFSASGLLMAVLNAHQSFLLPALAPSLYNIGQIAGALILARALPPLTVGDEAGPNVYGLALGAIVGALLHLGVQLPGLRKIGARLRFLADWRTPGLAEVLRLMGPRVLGLAVVQINFAVNVAFSSAMVAGSLTALNTAWFLTFFALGVIGQSIGSAVFPSLAALAAEGNLEGFKDRLAGALRGVLYLAFPATVGLIILGQPVAAVLFERGAWTPESTAATAWALAFYAAGIPGFALLEVLSRAFYALADTWTPVKIGLLSMASNIALSLVFIQFIGDPASLARGPFAGLALANALTTLLEGLALWWLLRRRLGELRDARVIAGAGRAALAAAGMGAALLAISAALPGAGALTRTVIGGGAGLAAFFGLSLLLGIDEARSVPQMALRRLRR